VNTKKTMTNAEEIEVGQEQREGVTILTPRGEIDLSRAPALRTYLSQALLTRPARLVINLAHVPYMDSSGVATFVEAMQLARRKGSRLVLCELQNRVRSIFEIARLDMVFTIVGTTEEALAV
jgi:anti-sigma B factor antagonist